MISNDSITSIVIICFKMLGMLEGSGSTCKQETRDWLDKPASWQHAYLDGGALQAIGIEIFDSAEEPVCGVLPAHSPASAK